MDFSALRTDKFGIAVKCSTCGYRKKPVGRSAPPELYFCDEDCSGYQKSPFPGSLWPNETEAEFGYPVGIEGTNLCKK